MNTTNDNDTFFDPVWDDVWQQAEKELLERQQISSRCARELQAAEPASIESLQQKAKASAWTRARLRSFLHNKPNSQENIHNHEDQEESTISSQHSTVEATNDEHIIGHVSRNNLEARSISWSQTFDTTPLYTTGACYRSETTIQYPYTTTASGQSNTATAIMEPISSSLIESVGRRATPTSDDRKTSAAKPKRQHKGPKIVDHAYVDYSLVMDEEVFKEGPLMCGTPIELLVWDDAPVFTHANSHEVARPLFDDSKLNRKTLQGSRRSRATDSFPKKLHLLLSCREYTSIITWLPHGRSFIVRDPEALTERVFPEFFKLKKYNSFIRQLSLWGFKRMTKGMNAKSYYHPLFLRGKAALVSRMTLTLIKGTGTKLKSNPDAEPVSIFYPLAVTSELDVFCIFSSIFQISTCILCAYFIFAH